MNVDELDINKALLLLRRNIFTIFLITLLSFSAVALYAYFMKPVFSSSVTLSVVNDQSSKLASVLPGQLSAFTDNSGKLETIRLTLQSRKFINNVLDNVDVTQQFFIEKRFKRIETNSFKNLQMKVNNLNDTLYESYFEVLPVNNDSYMLKIEEIDYKKLHNYGDEIQHDAFTIRLLKNGSLLNQSYFFKNRDKRTLVNRVLKNIKVHKLSDSVVKIVYNDSLPSRAKFIVESIAKTFITYALDKKTSELKQTLEFLDRQIIVIQENLSHEGSKLKNYQQKSNLLISSDVSSSIYENISVKNDEIKALILQLRAVKVFRIDLKNKNKLNTVSLINSGIDTTSIQSMIEQYRVEIQNVNEMKFQQKDILQQMTDNTKLNSLIQLLEDKKNELVQLRINFTYEHPNVLLSEKKINTGRRQIQQYISGYIKKSLNIQKRLKSKILNNVLVVAENLKEKVKSLKSDLKEKNLLLQSLPEKDLIMQDLKRKFTLSENVYTFLLQKKMEIEMKKASTLSNTRIIEDAIFPSFPIKPNKKMIVLIGFLVGLILGISLVFLKEILNIKVRDVGTLESLTDVPVYGTLPAKENQRFFKEALRNIRTNLQFILPQDKRCKLILISSTVAGEGKTTVVAGLASVIAATDKKVLLMDLDLRKPRLYKEFSKSNKIGMTNYLTENIPLVDAIQSVEKNLDFFPAGSVPPNPSELLMSNKFAEVVKELVKEYDYILFDSAPIGTVTDANLLLKYVDLFLLIVRANYAEKSYLKSFNKMREDKNIKSTGVILNHVKLDKSSNYGYGYGYGYGYDYNYGVDKKNL